MMQYYQPASNPSTRFYAHIQRVHGSVDTWNRTVDIDIGCPRICGHCGLSVHRSGVQECNLAVALAVILADAPQPLSCPARKQRTASVNQLPAAALVGGLT